MPGNFQKEDSRILKTRKAVLSSLPVLLNHHKFAKISVHDICEESLVSRTAFYSHFQDKYDLLGRWLTQLREQFWTYANAHTREQTDEMLFGIVRDHFAIMTNLFPEADQEHQHLLLQFLSPVNRLPEDTAEQSEDTVTLSNFLTGGMFNVIICWLNNNQRASEEKIKAVIAFLHKMILVDLEWFSKALDENRNC
jgi:AcrR family transcriptional regulator